jgi:hypothetical protein
MPTRSSTTSAPGSVPDRPYQLNGESHVAGWLASTDDIDARLAMLDWLPTLAKEPRESCTAMRDRSPGLPLFTAAVPGTSAFVDYVVIDQFRTVVILAVVDVRLEG